MPYIGGSLADGFSIKGTPAYTAGAFLSDGFKITGGGYAYQFQAGADMLEGMTLHATASAAAVYQQGIVDSLFISQVTQIALAVALTSGIAIHPGQVVALGVKMIAGVTFKSIAEVLATYGEKITDDIIFFEKVALFLGGSLQDGIGIDAALHPLWNFVRVAHDGFTIGSSIAPTLLVRMYLRDCVEFEDAGLIQALFDGQLQDGITISIAFIDPGGGITTWAINTRTSAVTEYDNFQFNSFARMGNRYLGATSAGLWVLDGPTDDAASIPTRTGSGYMQLGGSHFTSFKSAYLGLRIKDGGRDFYLKLHAGDGREYIYAVTPQDMMTTRVNLAKGLRSRYFRWTLETLGADFDLDSIEFVPITATRRV